jgi:2',3'-cyclic-nucleotide 2'-phosphodiesterase (5'-nucleotidase family)
MLKLKNYMLCWKHFVLIITFLFLLTGCKSTYEIVKIEGKQISISNPSAENAELENFIKPYREHINKDLDSILAFCPETLDKSKGEWQTNIGNFMSDVCLLESNKLFVKRYQKSVDICLLNHGGIRSIIPKGNVTARTAFEVMPFENNMIVVALTGMQIRSLVDYLIQDRKPHPLSGLKLVLDDSLTIKSISIQGKTLDLQKIYYVATSDYLSNGGDNMVFFLKNEGVFDLDYKIRNVLIDYFKEVNEVIASHEPRIIIESK